MSMINIVVNIALRSDLRYEDRKGIKDKNQFEINMISNFLRRFKLALNFEMLELRKLCM